MQTQCTDNYVNLLEDDYIKNNYYIVANNLVVGDNEKGLFIVVTDNPYIGTEDSCEAIVYAELTKKQFDGVLDKVEIGYYTGSHLKAQEDFLHVYKLY
ncbi:hypothetical protein AB9M75_04190 [Lactobacillus sp. AN1001]